MMKVIGFGNTIHGDDGFAAHVIERLGQQWQAEAQVQCCFGGSAGLNAMALFDDCEQVLVVDIVRSEAAKAPLAWYSVDEVIELDFADGEHCAHGQGLGYLFKSLQAVSGKLPQISCLLCASDIPQSYTTQLSDAIAAQVTQAGTLLNQRIEQHLAGFPITVEDVSPGKFDGIWTGMAKLPKKRFAGKVMIFERAGAYFLTSASCPHQGFDLSEQGLDEQGKLVCPLHQLEIDVFAVCRGPVKRHFKVDREGETFVITGFNE